MVEHRPDEYNNIILNIDNGSIFSYNKDTMRLVSTDAYESARSRDLVYLYCDHCNEVFGTPKNDLQNKVKKRGWDANRYCSRSCMESHRKPTIRQCINCGKDTICDKFCSHRCSAIFINLARGFSSRNLKEHPCEMCGKCTLNPRFCSQKCHRIFTEMKYVDDWKNGTESGLAPAGSVCRQVRKYIFKKYGMKCARCGWCEINPTSGKIPVQIEHIDGDFRNCCEENLIVLCPNCHSLTPTYMGLNRGKGRDVNGVRRRGRASKPTAFYEQEEEFASVG